MQRSYVIRDFRSNDAEEVNRVAVAAFAEFKDAYSDWSAFSQNIDKTAALAEIGELIVATMDERVAGSVVYVGPGKPKRDIFQIEWPIIRMLVVEPAARGCGIGGALTNECIRRAERDDATVIALHTSPIMKVALPMYERMGFEFLCEAPSSFGVPYGIYIKNLATDSR